MSEPDAHDATRTAGPPPADATRTDADPSRPTATHVPPPSGEADTLARPVPVAPTPLGFTLPGYQILGVLGRGGMGIVYHARHLALKREVAVKMILAGRHAGPVERARFRTEVEAVARLQHPNIVQIHEVGEEDGNPYCALEYVSGGTLAGRTARGPMPTAEAAKLVEAVARAMHLAHSRNVVHRDLKPANVMIAADGTPKITDFGLARQLDREDGQTHTGAVMGTPAYMAPEQAVGRTSEAGPVADVYSLGAILYDCLTGRPPLKGDSTAATLALVRTEDPAPPSRWHPSVPLDLDTICLRCLQKQPERRYSSAAELADDLARYLRGEPILARPVRVWERAAKWAKRRPAAAGLIASAVLAVGVGVGALALFAERERVSAVELGRKNEDLTREQEAKQAALQATRVSQARLALDRGLILCEQGDVARGLVALTQALAAAVVAQDADLEAVVRFNLSAWERQAWRVRAVLPPPPGTVAQAVAVHPTGTPLAVALNNHTVQLWDATEGNEGKVLHTLSHAGDAAVTHLSVAFTPDGRTLVVRTDKAVHVWDVGTGKPACPPLRHDVAVTALALDPSGKFVVTGDANGVGRVWDVAIGQPREHRFEHKGAIDAVAVRFDGKKVLTGSRLGAIRVWDLESGKADGAEVMLKGGGVTTATFGALGKTLLVGTRSAFAVGTVHLLDTATLNPVSAPLACDGPVEEAVFGPGEKTVVVRTGFGAASASARVWHPRNETPVSPLPHRGDVRRVVVSPDGRSVLTAGGGGAARFWDPSSGAPVGSTLYHDGSVGAAAFSGDGRTLVTLDGDIRVWQAPPTLRRANLPHPGAVNAVAFSGDGLTLTGGKGGARLWRTATGEAVGQPLPHPGEVMTVAFSPDGKLALTAGSDTTARLWDTTTGEPRGILTGHKAAVAVAAFTHDGTGILTGSFDGTARLWSADGRPLGEPLKHNGPVQAVAFSPNGKLALTGSDDKTAALWRVPTGERVGQPMAHPRAVESVAFSHAGRTAFTGSRYDAAIRCWDTTTGAETRQLTGHPTGVWALALTPTLLLSGGADGAARFWDVNSGEPVGPAIQHQDVVRAVVFDPAGQTALTASYDSTARRTHAPTGIPIGPLLPQRGKLRAAAFSPDGRTAGTAGWDGTAVLWDTPPAKVGPAERLALWARVSTGVDVDEGGAVRPLGAAAWADRRRELGASPAE